MAFMKDEKQIIRQMRVTIKKEDLNTKEVDICDSTLRRFLESSEFNVEKACKKVLKYLRFRRENVPQGSIAEGEISNILSQNKMYVQGFDKRGRSIAVAIGANHTSNGRDLQEQKRFIIYCFDKLCSRGTDQILLIVDLKGFRYTTSDLQALVASLELMEAICSIGLRNPEFSNPVFHHLENLIATNQMEYYPETLAKVYLLHVPYVFHAIWKMALPFVQKKTKKKITFVEEKKVKSTLLEDIDESQLPEMYGGRLPLIPIHASK